MGLTMRERQAVTREMTRRFQKATKKERGQILDQFVALTHYNRVYAAFVLRSCGKRVVRMVAGRRLIFVPGHGRAPGAPRKGGRPKGYRSRAFLAVLKRLWALSDGLCGKRLVAFLRVEVPELQRRGLLKFKDPAHSALLVKASAATLDRLLAHTKREARLGKGRSTTRPGTLLKHQVPIRTFADWSDTRPGFCEVDLVAHDGGSAYGEYAFTLTLTDVATGWTECEPVQNKAQKHVFAALQAIRSRLPFPLLGLDSDNGSEFINADLVCYCEAEGITFTRSRPYRKNDNCFVEQKNYSIVRRSVAYYRYHTERQLALLAALYGALRLYGNYFQPVMKLKEKVRTGSRLTRRYDEPQTPYARLLAHRAVAPALKEALQREYEGLNIVALKRELHHLQHALFRLAQAEGPPPQPPRNVPFPGVHHPWRSQQFGTVVNTGPDGPPRYQASRTLTLKKKSTRLSPVAAKERK